MIKAQVMISEPLMKELKRISKIKDIPLSELFRRGMEEYVAKVHKEGRDTLEGV